MNNKSLEMLASKLAQSNDNATKAELLLELGFIELYRKHFDEAIKNIEEAQKFFLEEKNVAMIASCLAELALAHYKKNSDRLIRAHTLLNDAKYLIENNKISNNSEIKAKILHYYGIINYSEKQYSDALKYYKKAQELLKSDCLEYAKVLDSLSLFYLRSANYQIANKYLQESLHIKTELENELELSKTQLLLGRYYISIENHVEAGEILEQAAQTALIYDDCSTIARIYDELAKIYLYTCNLEAAGKFSQMSLEKCEGLQKDLVYAFSACTKARILLNENQLQAALDIIYNEVLDIFEKSDSKRGIALSKQVLAEIYRESGDIEKSLEYSHEAIDIYRQIDLSLEIAKSYYQIGLTYKLANNSQMSASSLLEALRIAKSNELPLITQKIEDLLYEIDIDEWSSIVEKTARKQKSLDENKSLLETLDIVGAMSGAEIAKKDPLLSLLRVGRSIAAETNVDVLMEIIAEETKVALEADRCTVFILDREKNELWSKVALGMGAQEIRFPADMGLAGHVIETGETINIKDAYHDARFNKEIDKQTGYSTHTILCMPVRNINHEIVGVFQVLNKRAGRFFTDKDEDLLVAIGSSAGIALENARLFKKQQSIYEEQKKSFVSFINTLAASIDARDKITSGHSHRVTKYTTLIAKKMGISPYEIEVYEHAAVLHDIGKIGIKDSVLCKEGQLTPEEYKHIQEHVKITYDILKTMYFEERFKDVPIIASSHHEKYDGSGYFRGIKGEEIPLGGRILAVADVFDAITSKRHYRDKMPIQNVLEILTMNSNSHFDGSIVETFFDISAYHIATVLSSAKDLKVKSKDKKFLKNYSIREIYNALQKNPLEISDEEKHLIETFNKYYYI